MIKRFTLPVLSIAVWATGAYPARAELFAISIGIDIYQPGIAGLRGAHNDAEDVAGALAKLTAGENITLLVNENATRRNIESAWASTLDKAGPDDTIVLHYAGHGSQEDEPQGRGGEADGKNENFILSGFLPQAPASRERLVDDEIFAWLQQADRKGVNVVFVADSCHSGGMARSVPAIVDDTVRYRTAGEFDIEFDPDSLPPPAVAQLDEESFEHVTFVAATVESRKVPEIVIGGEYRGALSWAFARALEGDADRDRDGWLTQKELTHFLLPQVEAKVEGQQTPEVLPLRSAQTRLIRIEQSPPAAPPPATVVDPPPATLKVKAVGPLAGSLSAARAAEVDVALASESDGDFDIIWDSATGDVVHVPGGTIGHAADADDLVPILAKFSGIKWLRANATGAPLFAQVTSGNDRYYRDEDKPIFLEIQEFDLPHLTLFNLAPNGRVEFFLPRRGRQDEAQQDWRGRRHADEFSVAKPPYGAEHVVAIATEAPAYGLHALLRSMKTREEWQLFPQSLRDQLGGTPFQVGVVGIYTGDTRPTE